MSPTATDTTVTTGTHGIEWDQAELAAVDLVDDETLVEEISIDGMCGVY
jgi:mycofactocin precursor